MQLKGSCNIAKKKTNESLKTMATNHRIKNFYQRGSFRKYTVDDLRRNNK